MLLGDGGHSQRIGTGRKSECEKMHQGISGCKWEANLVSESLLLVLLVLVVVNGGLMIKLEPPQTRGG